MVDYMRVQNELMAAGLKQWAKDKLFSAAEVRLIAKKRTNFEYVIAAPNAEVVDFLRYIKFETDLDRLLQSRLKKTKRNKDYQNAAKTIGRVFNDKNLFVLHINFCLERKYNSAVKKVFSKGVRVFPTEPDIWIMAANFELDVNKNITAARVLLQLALRYNKASERIWTNFFTLELKYWYKISKRNAKNNFKPLEANTENKVDVGESEDAEEGTNLSAAGDPADNPSATSNNNTNPFLACAIPKLIYNNAIKAIPNSYEFRARFLEIVRKFQNTEPLIDIISKNISETFPLNEQALITHADLQFRILGKFNIKAYESACSIFENAIKNSKSSSVWEYYIKYMRAKLATMSLSHLEPVQYLTTKLLETCEKAPPSPSTYLIWIDALVSTGRGEEANKIANRSIKKLPKSATLRLQKIELLIKSGQPKGKILNAFERAVKKSDASAELWYRYVQWMTLNDTFDTSSMLTEDEMENELQTTQADKAVVSIASRCLKSVFSVLSGDDFNLLKMNLLNTIFFHFGILPARTFLAHALAATPNTLAFCAHALAIEEAQPKEVFAAQAVRLVYEAAVRNYGETPACEDMWLQYIKFEQSQLQISRAGDIYWRAKRALKDNPASFMAKYEQIKQN